MSSNDLERQYYLIDRLLEALSKAGLLDSLIIVGSWCMYFYKHHFQDSLLERIRTTDIDIDVSQLVKVKDRVSIPNLLAPLDFEIRFAQDNFIFLVHPDLKIEFLSAEKGKGTDKTLMLPGFDISAQPLRFLDLLEKEIIEVGYKGLSIRIPHPVWFAIHKLIISQRRRSKKHNEKMNIKGKSYNDARQGIGVLAMMLRMGQSDKIAVSLETLTKKEKKLLLQTVREHMDHIEATVPELIGIVFEDFPE